MERERQLETTLSIGVVSVRAHAEIESTSSSVSFEVASRCAARTGHRDRCSACFTHVCSHFSSVCACRVQGGGGGTTVGRPHS